MLDVSLTLVAAAAMRLSIVLPVNQFEIDGLNSPTAKPIPSGSKCMGTPKFHFKPEENVFQTNSTGPGRASQPR